jgi:hypothetical protein
VYVLEAQQQKLLQLLQLRQLLSHHAITVIKDLQENPRNQPVGDCVIDLSRRNSKECFSFFSFGSSCHTTPLRLLGISSRPLHNQPWRTCVIESSTRDSKNCFSFFSFGSSGHIPWDINGSEQAVNGYRGRHSRYAAVTLSVTWSSQSLKAEALAEAAVLVA